MPTADAYGQGIQLAALTDPPNIEALSPAMNAILARGVLRFASATARGATLTSPVDGTATYLIAEGRLEVRISGAWVVMGSSLSTWQTVSLNSPWTHDGNSNGSFQWRAINFFGETMLHFRGAIARSSYPGSVPAAFTLTATALPTTARPAVKRTIVIPVSDINSTRITLKLDIHPTGHLEAWGFGTADTPAWVGFNGCSCSL